MTESFVIEGGRPLSGRLVAAGNKNGALPILAACLLAREPVVLHNVPRILDVETMVDLIAELGVAIRWEGRNTVYVDASEVARHDVDEALPRRIRASILLAGPL